MTNKIILLISPEPWGKNFVSKHHYANYLAKNNTVYFLNPASSFSKNPFGSVQCKLSKVKENLVQVDYVNLLPRLNNLPKAIQKATYKKQAQQIQKAIGVANFDIVWSFDPFRYFDQTVWKFDKSIYHTVDVHFNKSYETTIAQTSHLVLLTSELLREKLIKSNQRIYNLGHAADIINFEEKVDDSKKLPGKNKIKSGLIANYNNNIDYDLIADIAAKNLEIDFIFVGPYTSNNLGGSTEILLNKIKKLKENDNVFFIGSVPSDELIGWMQSFHINLVLYKEERRDIIINPHKMMGYFYAGNITICSWFNEYKDVDDTFLIMTKNNHEIPDKIAETAQRLSHYNADNLKAKRRQFAIINSYPNKIAEINSLLYSKA
jgi:glycosyltransferase involved in cell wall biosynthesis